MSKLYLIRFLTSALRTLVSISLLYIYCLIKKKSSIDFYQSYFENEKKICYIDFNLNYFAHI